MASTHGQRWIIDENHYIIVVGADGLQKIEELSLPISGNDEIVWLKQPTTWIGGGSSTLYFNGKSLTNQQQMVLSQKGR